MLIHNACSFITETQYETLNNTNCVWIFPKCELFNFSDSFFGEQVNLETENRFVHLTEEKKDRSSSCGTNKSSFLSGLNLNQLTLQCTTPTPLVLNASPDVTTHNPTGNPYG